MASRRRALLAVVALLAATVGVVAHSTGVLAWLQRDTVDARYSLRGNQGPPANVVVVGIDNDSVGQLPRFPFSRRLDARVLQNLHRAGARLVVFDLSFDRPTTVGADAALFEAAAGAPPVVFATTLISPSGQTQVLGGNANLASIGARAAAADLVPDPDGVIRHLLTEVNRLPTIAMAVAETLQGHRPRTDAMHGGWIDFPGPPGTVEHLSFANVLRGRFDHAVVRGKVIVVGATAPVLQDQHSTAAGSPMSGPEIQADAIATMLHSFPLRSPRAIDTLLLIVGLGLFAPLTGLRLGTLGTGLAGLAALCLWMVGTQVAFNRGAVLDFADPLVSLLLGTGGTVLSGMWADSREHQRLRELFAADAGEIVEQILHRPGERPLPPTAIIAGYQLEQVLGRGGMGVIYRATQLALGRTVAIKVIATEHAGDPTFRTRFTSESRIAAAIEHPNVIPVYEAGEDKGLLFIAMRLVDGFDLEHLLTRTGPLTAERAARMLAQIAAAIDAAHARGLVHRDVKPANVLVTNDEPEHIYLTDFGVAKELGGTTLSRVTRATQWVGTLDYLAPEQIRGEAITTSADIYALTGLLCHCLTGETPFPRDSDAATMFAHVSAPVPLVSRRRPGLPAELDAVIERGLAKDPSRRFPTATALARAYADALGITPQPSDPEPKPAKIAASGPAPSQSAPTVLSD